MPTPFHWFCIVTILAVTFAGGFYPLSRSRDALEDAFPMGEAFSAGVFLALSLVMMLPSANLLLGKAFPDDDFPLAPLIGVTAFLFLLALSHLARKVEDSVEGRTSPTVPVITTLMIVIPSFFLGAALGVSATGQAILIFIAILLHKSSAAFALALKIAASSLSRPWVWVVFSLFAFSTPTGILIGGGIASALEPRTMILIKGVVLAMASGTFLFMATLHDLQSTALIRRCRTGRGFTAMLAGFLLTALVRLLMGEAHHLG
ncbi:ZIP family metal transporter [Myxococcota bacterium]|nr:ZIP family metal transporter [Myxococcota bacterium]